MEGIQIIIEASHIQGSAIIKQKVRTVAIFVPGSFLGPVDKLTVKQDPAGHFSVCRELIEFEPRANSSGLLEALSLGMGSERMRVSRRNGAPYSANHPKEIPR